MHIGIVTPRYPPNNSGGGETSARMLAENLADVDRISDVAVLSFDGTETERVNGIEVSRIRDLSPTITELQNVVAYRHLRRRLEAFDIVHAYNMELHPAVGALTDGRSFASVGTLNSYHYFPKSVANASPGTVERLYELLGHPTTGRLLEYFIRKIDAYVAISDTIRDVYTDHGYSSEKIEVVPNMLDPAFGPPDNSSSSGDGQTLLYVGELSEQKGVDVLIRALASLPPEYRLRIVGDGQQYELLQSLANTLGCSDRVVFEGWLPYEEVPAQYASADVFVHPGIWPEPFGRTVLEAMQAGLPVVCTDIGGPADIVRQPELRCPPDDAEAMASAIKRAMADDDRIGRENTEYVDTAYRPQRVVSDIVDIYERLVSAEKDL